MAEDIDGLAHVLANLDIAVVAMMGPAAHATVDLVAALVLDDAKAGAAVLTGELRDSLHIEASESAVGVFKDVVTDSDHAIPQEYGTSDMPAHPFLRPAVHRAEGTLEATGEAVYRKTVPNLS